MPCPVNTRQPRSGTISPGAVPSSASQPEKIGAANKRSARRKSLSTQRREAVAASGARRQGDLWRRRLSISLSSPRSGIAILNTMNCWVGGWVEPKRVTACAPKLRGFCRSGHRAYRQPDGPAVGRVCAELSLTVASMPPRLRRANTVRTRSQAPRQARL